MDKNFKQGDLVVLPGAAELGLPEYWHVSKVDEVKGVILVSDEHTLGWINPVHLERYTSHDAQFTFWHDQAQRVIRTLERPVEKDSISIKQLHAALDSVDTVMNGLYKALEDADFPVDMRRQYVRLYRMANEAADGFMERTGFAELLEAGSDFMPLDLIDVEDM